MSANYHKPNPALEKAKQMPPLEHWPQSGYGFDIMQSGVVDWLCQQRECRQALFNFVKNSGVITYDMESRCWRGVAWDGSTNKVLKCP